MKRSALFITLFLIGIVAAEAREFKKTDGNSVLGEVQDYSLKTDKLAIKADEGEVVQLNARSLIDEDYIYVRDWDATRLFLQDTSFQVYLNDAESKNKWRIFLWWRDTGIRPPILTSKTDFNRMAYKIRFENKTGYDLENVEVKYCIFYRQEYLDYKTEKRVSEIVVRPSIHSFTILPNKERKKLESNSVVIREKEIVFSSAKTRYRFLENSNDRRFRGELIGCIFRFSMTTQSGQTAMREFRLPKDLSEEYAWVEPRKDDAVWPDDELDETNDTKAPPTRWDEKENGMSP